MTVLPLAAAQALIAATLAHARALDAKPLAVIVLDAGGHPIAFARADGASFGRLDIARAKAWGALAMDCDTAALAERAKGNPAFFTGLSAVFDGRIALSPGGVVLRDAAGVAIGAMGVSGDTGETDLACARAAIAAAQGTKGGT
ncbi:MAG: heme-binding protein [Sphingomonadales bacterium]|nr:heme-binding protein [Sphingomonadales bacterium]